MALVSALKDTGSIYLPVAYGMHPVRGARVMHETLAAGSALDHYLKQALAEGPWEELVRLYIKGREISAPDFHFHPGDGADAADAFFPADSPHPWAASVSVKAPFGATEQDLDDIFGVYKCLKVADYDEDGNQLDAGGSIVAPTDPRTEYFYSANPAHHAADQFVRWGRRKKARINWPAWCQWRDYNAEGIDEDDGSYTPREPSAQVIAGTLPAGTYYLRLVSRKGSDLSSPSKELVVTLGAPGGIRLAWSLKDGLTVDDYRVYWGSASGAQTNYKAVGSPALTYDLTSTAGATSAAPPALASGVMLRQVPRFESHLFFTPPYDLASALDRIAQICCADWQWANGLLRFMSPEDRAPVFTFDAAETGTGSFRAIPVDRRQRPNQIVVNYRDLDDVFLDFADPVVLPSPDASTSHPWKVLQTKEGRVKPFQIDGGVMRRGQAMRVGTFWGRTLIDADWEAQLAGSPKSYHVMPGDVAEVTNALPGWEAVKFKVFSKEEGHSSKLGDDLRLRLYQEGLYSDTDYDPLPSPLPRPATDPFSAPPEAAELTLTTDTRYLADDGIEITIVGAVVFAESPDVIQRGRVYWKRPTDSDFVNTNIILTPDSNLEAAFEVAPAGVGTHHFKIVTESEIGVTEGIASATDYPHVVDPLDDPAAVAGLAVANVSRAGLRLTYSENAEPDVYAYLVERNTGSGWVTPAGAGRIDRLEWTDTAPLDGAQYRVRALARGGRVGDPSATVTFTPAIFGTTTPVVFNESLVGFQYNAQCAAHADMTEDGKRSIVRTHVRRYYLNPFAEPAPAYELEADDVTEGAAATVSLVFPSYTTETPRYWAVAYEFVGGHVGTELELPVALYPPDTYDVGQEFYLNFPAVKGATSGMGGVAGLAPSPQAGDQVKFLRGDGTYQMPAGSTAAATANTPAGTISATNVQDALNELDTEKLAKAGGTMTGLLTLSGAPTSSLHAATKQYVDSGIAAVVNSAPAVLDTLAELSTALGADPNFATTMATALGLRLRVDTAAQGLTTTQQGNGRTNLGLGTAAVKNVAVAGNAGNTEVVLGNDTRLSDARTPAPHASSHASGGSDPVTLAQSQVTNLTTDLAAKMTKASNLSDVASVATARTNLGLGTAATQNVPASGNAAAGEVVKGSDTRLTDSRAPSGAAAGDLTGTYPNPTLAATGVTAGTYYAPDVTVDAKGRITGVTGLTPSTALADVTTFAVASASRAGIVLSWAKSAEDEVRGYRIERNDGSGWSVVNALLQDTTWTDPTYPVTGTQWRIKAVGRAGRLSANWATVPWVLATLYGTTTPVLSDLLETSAKVQVTVEPHAGLTAVGRAALLAVKVVLVEQWDEITPPFGTLFNYYDVGVFPVDSTGGRITLPSAWDALNNIITTGPEARTFTYNISFVFVGGDGTAVTQGIDLIDPTVDFPKAEIGAAGIGRSTVATADPIFVETTDSRMTNARAPSGAAGGDLTGTYPNPTVAVVGWTAPTLLNGWVNFGGSFMAAGYRKQNGRVELRGGIKSGTVTAGTVLLTLPAGYRPSAILRFGGQATQNPGDTQCILDVAANGNVSIVSNVGNSFLSLTGIAFDAS